MRCVCVCVFTFKREREREALFAEMTMLISNCAQDAQVIYQVFGKYLPEYAEFNNLRFGHIRIHRARLCPCVCAYIYLCMLCLYMFMRIEVFRIEKCRNCLYYCHNDQKINRSLSPYQKPNDFSPFFSRITLNHFFISPNAAYSDMRMSIHQIKSH